jgi:predicted DCC family thiol-disulfide oxidoreductase YuxK
MEAPILLYDGHCALCNFFVRLVLRFDPNKKFKFATLDSPFATELKTSLRIVEPIDSVIYIYQGKYYLYHAAVYELLKQLRYPIKVFRFLRFLPNSINLFLYKFIAKNRYHWFGKYDSCPLLPAENRNQFVA